MEKDLGCLSGGLEAQSDLTSCEDNTKLFTKIDCFGFLFGCLGSLKPCKALPGSSEEEKGSRGEMEDVNLGSFISISGQNDPTTPITKRTTSSKPHHF